MAAVIAILVALITAGVTLLNGTSNQSRRAGTDLLSGLIEQARTTAIMTRSFIVLAIAEPGDLPNTDERCHLGLFKLDAETWPEDTNSPLSIHATMLRRWQTLNTGIVLLGTQSGDKNSKQIPNPIDEEEIVILCGGTKNLSVKVHVIVFNPHGGLHLPIGSTPVVLRVAEGGYRNGEATPNMRDEQKNPTENRLRVGRVAARSYQIDE